MAKLFFIKVTPTYPIHASKCYDHDWLGKILYMKHIWVVALINPPQAQPALDFLVELNKLREIRSKMFMTFSKSRL